MDNVDQENNTDQASDSILLSIVYATINVPFSQVSKFLAAYNLSKSQLSVIRKVRRQVKNRVSNSECIEYYYFNFIIEDADGFQLREIHFFKLMKLIFSSWLNI